MTTIGANENWIGEEAADWIEVEIIPPPGGIREDDDVACEVGEMGPTGATWEDDETGEDDAMEEDEAVVEDDTIGDVGET